MTDMMDNEMDERLDWEYDAADADEGRHVPPGEYEVTIIECAKSRNKNGSGHRLAITYQVSGGEHDGWDIWDSIHLWHDNPKAVAVAKKRMNRLCRAVGMMSIATVKDLEGKLLKVSVRARRDNPARVEISRFIAKADSQPGVGLSQKNTVVESKSQSNGSVNLF